MKINARWLVWALFGSLAILRAEDEDILLWQPEERQAVKRQATEFGRAWRPVLGKAAESAVRIWYGKRRLAYGTVVADGTKVLTKWSELEAHGDHFMIDARGGQTRGAKIIGVYPDEDLALLEFAGPPLPAVKWSASELPLGAFVATPQPDGKPASYGVVSVRARNLRERDQAFLGIRADPKHASGGVRIAAVEEGSGAQQAGLLKGDMILKIGDREISGLLELRNALTGTQPGDRVRIDITRDGKPDTVEVELGNRPDLPDFGGARLEAMRRMGGEISRIGSNFPSAVQTDMRPKPNQIGGPVVNLAGEVVGITLARADRTRSFFMPAADAEKLLATQGLDPSVARDRNQKQLAAKLQSRVPRRVLPRDTDLPEIRPDRLRQHLEEMQQLMESLRQEMELLDEER